MCTTVKHELTISRKDYNKNLKVLFQKDEALILRENGQVALKAQRIGDLYYVISNDKEEAHQIRNQCNDIEIWHRKLGHLNLKDVLELERRGIIPI